MSKKSGPGGKSPQIGLMRPYTGILAEPPRGIKWEVASPISYRRSIPAKERLDALFDFFGIERENWKALAVLLAFRHVPGFSPGGAPPKHPPIRDVDLIVTVDEYREAGNSITEACRLATKDYCKKHGRNSMTEENLRRLYYSAPKELGLPDYENRVVKKG